MKQFSALANREFLLFVAIVASALTLHVRQHLIDQQTTVTPPAAQVGRLCEPVEPSADTARIRPANCDVRTNVRTPHSAQPWV